MDLIYLIIVIVLVGVILWAVNTYVPMQAGVKTVLNIAVIVILVLWLLTLIFPGLRTVKVGEAPGVPIALLANQRGEQAGRVHALMA